MGTRYNKDDEVVVNGYPNEVYQVLEVRNPNSDSPDYVITHLGMSEDIDSRDQDMTVKASDIRKR